MKIYDIEALQILDSRGNPTVQVTVVLEDGSKGVFQVPSGASTGIHEAHELRDGREDYYHGKSVENAVENINQIKSKLIEKDWDQKKLDDELILLDGTENKEKLGANAILGISLAFGRAAAQYYNLPLWEYLHRLVNDLGLKAKKLSNPMPVYPFANVINGGLHSGNDLQVQEFMVIPIEGTMNDRIRAISEIYQTLKILIEEKYGKENTAVGDEGGFAPMIGKPKEALELLTQAVKKTGYEGKIGFALDAAASDFFDSKSGKYMIEKRKKLDYKELTKYYNDLIEKYPLISIEDPMGEDDFEGFKYFRKNVKKLKEKNPLNGTNDILIVGDDLLVTNVKRIQMAIKGKLCNSLLLKVNQIGSLTESIEAHKLSASQGWHTIVSHRSGETTDDFISDFAVAVGNSIKLGAPARGERTAKYNRLLNIFKD